MAEPAVDAATLVRAAAYGLLRHQNGKTFVLTGKMSTERANIIMLIEAAGGRVVDRVRSGVDMLVIPHGTATKFTKKTDDAYKYGVNVIDEDELGTMLLPSSDELERGVWASPA